MNPASRGPTAAPEIKQQLNTLHKLWIQHIFSFLEVHPPIDPVPSIMAVTVANALELPSKLECVPSSVETTVVIKAYGPFTKAPTIKSKTIFGPRPAELKPWYIRI